MKESRDVDMRPYNTFGVSVKARRVITCENEREVAEALEMSREERRYVVGGGSNILLLSDFDGSIIMPEIGGMEILMETGGEIDVRVGAGVEWDQFVARCVGEGWWGAENLSGIPGHIGASPVQNIGAYGVEAKDVIKEVEFIRADTLEKCKINGAECRFGYRSSIFKQELRGKVVITAVTYRLKKKGEARLSYGALRETVEQLGAKNLENIRRGVMSIRDSKLPDPKVTGNAGSFFKNPEVGPEMAERLKRENPGMPSYATSGGLIKIPAGWLIEQSGWKGRELGRAAVHDRQALVLVNKGGATGADIVALCEAIRGDVERKFGIKIEPEVNFV